jgi:microcystin-dependent protein
MSEPYIGQVMIFGGNFAPVGWAYCRGQLLAISENDALFNLIGTTYGGDGQSTFGLPDLQGRVPVHMGQGPSVTQMYTIGEVAGVEVVTLNTQQIPSHNHPMMAVTGTAANSASPGGNVLADEALALAQATADTYLPVAGTQIALAPNSIGPAGGNGPHDNMQPYLTLNYIISLYGVYPSPN